MSADVAAGNPFSQPGRWYRGNLHMHSTNSDGRRSPEEAVAWYRERGYDFVVLTDHRKTTDVSALSAPGFLVLPGIELDCVDPERNVGYHIVGIGVTPFSQDEATRRGPGQALVDAIRQAGGEALLCHPYWLGQEAADLAVVRGAFAVEVYNGNCALNGKEDSRMHWDNLLDRGHRLWGAAVDDTHHYDVDAGLGWVMVRAEALTPAALLTALRQGHFYASSGPALLDVRLQEGQLRVHTSPVAEIRIISNRGRGWVFRAAPGETVSAAVRPVPPAARGYLRVEAIDAQGRRAWSQPIFLE